MSKTESSPRHDEPEPDSSLSEQEREDLEWIAENNDRVGPIAERMLQLDDEDEEESEVSSS